jgi:hypothetical protein
MTCILNAARILSYFLSLLIRISCILQHIVIMAPQCELLTWTIIPSSLLVGRY